MGFIRKTIAGTAAVMTGGASLAVIQFRSDTERGTRETKKLRQELARQGSGGTIDAAASQVPATLDPQARTHEASGTRISDLNTSDVIAEPTDRAPGWKTHPTEPGKQRFWNGSSWTTMTR